MNHVLDGSDYGDLFLDERNATEVYIGVTDSEQRYAEAYFNREELVEMILEFFPELKRVESS